jgi:hypothetical protein
MQRDELLYEAEGGSAPICTKGETADLKSSPLAAVGFGTEAGLTNAYGLGRCLI